jgi:hypothetical protein
VNEDLSHTTCKARLDRPLRLWNEGTMTNWRQGWWFVRRLAMELLEEPDMEDIVEVSLGRQGQANGDVVDELDHAVWPVKPRL